MAKAILMALTLAAVAAFALTTGGAFAAISLNSSKSNIYKAINSNDAAAVAACTKGGGTVGKDPKGNSACVTSKKK